MSMYIHRQDRLKETTKTNFSGVGETLLIIGFSSKFRLTLKQKLINIRVILPVGSETITNTKASVSSFAFKLSKTQINAYWICCVKLQVY